MLHVSFLSSLSPSSPFLLSSPLTVPFISSPSLQYGGTCYWQPCSVLRGLVNGKSCVSSLTSSLMEWWRMEFCSLLTKPKWGFRRSSNPFFENLLPDLFHDVLFYSPANQSSCSFYSLCMLLLLHSPSQCPHWPLCCPLPLSSSSILHIYIIQCINTTLLTSTQLAMQPADLCVSMPPAGHRVLCNHWNKNHN